jgi:hypothetical protein
VRMVVWHLKGCHCTPPHTSNIDMASHCRCHSSMFGMHWQACETNNSFARNVILTIGRNDCSKAGIQGIQ